MDQWWNQRGNKKKIPQDIKQWKPNHTKFMKWSKAVLRGNFTVILKKQGKSQ